jgi:hypothetical protein
VVNKDIRELTVEYDQRIMLKEDQAQVSDRHLHRRIMDSLITRDTEQIINPHPQQISSAIVVANKVTLLETVPLKGRITR